MERKKNIVVFGFSTLAMIFFEIFIKTGQIPSSNIFFSCTEDALQKGSSILGIQFETSRYTYSL